MRIIFVRHGHPDYKLDCLTELGRRQAQAVARRLEGERINRICSSTMGRAMETADYIARLKSMEVEHYDFMREIEWGPADGEINLSDDYFDVETRGESLLNPNWMKEEPFCRNKVVGYIEAMAENLDKWLEQFGYFREGDYYRVKGGSAESVVMVSHGGSSTAALSRLFNLPYPLMRKIIAPYLTAVTIVSLRGEDGSLILPYFEIANDTRHVAGITAETVCQQKIETTL